MGNKKRFDKLTEPQALRDEAFVSNVRREYVEPLLTELCNAVSGYEGMDDLGKFNALMRLNEEHAPKGTHLMLDFGSFPKIYITEGGAFEEACAAVYSGDVALYNCGEVNGTKRYVPLIENSRVGVNGRGAGVGYLISRDGLPSPLYESLPLPFRVALIALYLRENVIVNYAESCRFAAGALQELTCRRVLLGTHGSGHLARFGWQLNIRDNTPENQMFVEIARSLRSRTAQEEAFFGGKSPFLAEHKQDEPRRRARNTSTELLIDFIERELPSRGLYVGRKGSGRRITWEQAYFMFDELHPNRYASKKSFADSYSNAKKKEREEGV